MNVKELIEILQRMPQDATAIIEDETYVRGEVRDARIHDRDHTVRISTIIWIRPSVVLAANRDRIIETLTGFGLTNPRVFGSVLHGDDSELSDLDLLVDAPEGTTYFDLGGAVLALKEALGIRIDLQMPGSLHERFRDKVLQEAKPL